MSDTSYPVIEPDGEELFFQNAWRTDQEQTLGDTECFDFNRQPSVTENLIVMKLTGQQLTEMLSALYIGAEFVYPEKYLEVLRPLLAATSCPPIMEEQECFEYPTYASFFRYTPANPFVEPDTVPDGYATQPFLVNGENGNDIPNYEHFDVIVPNAAITLDIDWWTTIAGQLPTIEIMVNGAGKVFIKMLTLPNGGLAVITLDNPPDLLDIIGGIVTSGENIIDLNQDLVSLPPETAQELIFEVDVAGAGLHTIYIVFLPILDDSFIPIRFGGGFRGVQLCDFVESPTMGITALRVEDCNLEQQIDGVWSVVDGWADFMASCIPSSGGGGGGAAAISPQMFVWDLGASVTNSTTSFATAISVSFTPTKSNFIALVKNLTLSNSAGGATAEIRLRYNGIAGEKGSLIQANGTGAREAAIDDFWLDQEIGVPHTFAVEMRSATASNTATLGSGLDQMVTFLEWNELSELFVEDVQYVGGVLQKKIAGVWINVVDIMALLSPIQTTANNALAAAANAQVTANSAVVVNNTQNIRMDTIEDRLDQIEDLDIPQINLTLANHESRIDALEAAIGTTEAWSFVYDFQAGQHGWAATSAVYVAGQGFRADSGIGFQITKTGTTVFDQRITHIKMEFSAVSGAGVPQDTEAIFHVFASDGNIRLSNAGSTINWIKADTYGQPYTPSIAIDAITGQYYLRKITILGRGINVFFT